MPPLPTILATLCIAQLIWSTRYAYRLQRHDLAAGYPILGHALHTLVLTLLIACQMPKSLAGTWPSRTVAAAIVVLPILHAWLLIKFDRLGEKHRERQPTPRE